MRWASIFLSGFLFGLGLAVSNMINPAKVLNFLDIAGTWDPTLLLVMTAGLVVTFIGYRLVLARPEPFFSSRFHLPASNAIDARLMGGAALFGIGWGLAGLCPGPAIAGLVYARPQSIIFVFAMVAGMLIAHFGVPGPGA